MISDLKKEMNKFVTDLEENIQNKSDLEYIKEKMPNLFEMIIDEMEKVINIKEEKMSKIVQTQQQLEAKMDRMEKIIDNIEKDIYSDEGFDFEIVCPYCDNEFVVDADDEQTQIRCPKCENIIELDWAEEDDDTGCAEGGCFNCHGCEIDDNDEDEDM